MFTGIIETIGTVTEISRRGSYRRLILRPVKRFSDLVLGESIAVDGCCLTVAAIDQDKFTVEASRESVGRTIIENYRVGSRVNLERALRLESRLGGHIISGHVDCVGVIEKIKREGDNLELFVGFPERFAELAVNKGSIAINGISLTINGIEGNNLSVNLIPHTRNNTTVDELKKGDRVNLEFDMIGKYVASLLKKETKAGVVTLDRLKDSGW
jgi:riboflavin synthase